MAIIKMGVINGCFSDQQSDFAVDYGILFPTIANSFKTINWEPYLDLYGKNSPRRKPNIEKHSCADIGRISGVKKRAS